MEPIGICSGYGRTICGMTAGADVVKIAKDGRRWYGLVNNRAVLAAKDSAKLLPVVLDIVSFLCKKAKTGTFKYASDSKSGQLEDVEKYIKENKDQYDLFLLDTAGKPDELVGNAPKQASLQTGLSVFRDHLTASTRNIVDVRHLAGILLKTEPAKDMWGGKDVAAVFTGIRNGMVKLAEDAEITDRRLDRMDGAAKYMQECMSNSRVQDKVRMAAGKIVEDFAQVKSYMSEMAQILRRLYEIDKVFKAHTGYPATWFLMSSILMDFMYEYESLVGNLAGTSAVEAQVVEPMLLWKIRTTGAA